MTTDYRSERIDLGKLWTQFIHKLWIIIAATIVGAIIGVLAYVIYSNVKDGNTVYQIRNDYYITFDYEAFPNGPDYFNAFTWDGFLRDDPIVNYALDEMDGITKEQVVAAVSGEIIGDYRVLTVIVRGTDASMVQTISDAYKSAMAKFGEQMEMIKTIEVWTDAPIEEYDAYTRDANAAFLGGLIALLISLFAVLISVILDDRIYTEKDWLYRYADIPYLGMEGTDEYNLNSATLLEADRNYRYLSVDEFAFDIQFINDLKESDGTVIKLEAGKTPSKDIDKVVNTLKKQGINIAGVIF